MGPNGDATSGGRATGERGGGGDAAGPLGDILDTFRHRISEAQGDDAIAEQHYLLGVACGRAAAVTAPTPDEGWTLLYHLGTTLDSVDESTRALAVFLELQGTAGEYRDVEQWVGRLTATLLGG